MSGLVMLTSEQPPQEQPPQDWLCYICIRGVGWAGFVTLSSVCACSVPGDGGMQSAVALHLLHLLDAPVSIHS